MHSGKFWLHFIKSIEVQIIDNPTKRQSDNPTKRQSDSITSHDTADMIPASIIMAVYRPEKKAIQPPIGIGPYSSTPSEKPNHRSSNKHTKRWTLPILETIVKKRNKSLEMGK